jgi:hypothetical protein
VATITTTTQLNPYDFPGQSYLDRKSSTGSLFHIVWTGSGFQIWRMPTSGGWVLQAGSTATFNRSGVQEYSGFFVDTFRMGHLAYRVYEGGKDRIFYRRVNIETDPNQWGGELLVAEATAGSAGAAFSGLDLVAMPNGSQCVVAIVVAAIIGAQHSWIVRGVRVTSGASWPSGTSVDNTLVSGGSTIYGYRGTTPWTASGRHTPAIDFQHNGDAKTPVARHLWAAVGRERAYSVRLAWDGARWVFSSPPTTVGFFGAQAMDSKAARWDGARWVIADVYAATPDVVTLWERDASNSRTTTRNSPVHPAGVIRNLALTYDPVTKDARVYAVGTASALIYFVDYIRAQGTWSSWSQFSATAVTGTNPNNYGVRRGAFGNNRYDVYSAGGVSPYTLTHTPQTLDYAPNVPTWVTPQNGAAADVGAALVLDWFHSDPDPGDQQSAFALSRQIGTGTIAYLRLSDMTWQATEQKNTSGTSAVTLPAGWAADADPAYTFKVKTWDTTNLSSLYSAGLTLVPSTPVNPALTAPGATVTADTVTATWTASVQTMFRVELWTQGGGERVYDSGWQADPDAREWTVPRVLADGSSWQLRLTTTNAERLPSTTQVANFAVDYLEPPSPVVQPTGRAHAGMISVAVGAAAPTAGQPTVGTVEVYRRPITAANVLGNTSVETDLTGWTAGSRGTMTRSSAQGHHGAWSIRFVPNGTTAVVYPESAASPVIAGQRYRAAGWIRQDTANKAPQWLIHWYDAAGAYMSSSSWTGQAVAGAWLFGEVSAVAPANATGATIAVGETNTPAAGDAFYVDDVWFGLADDNVGELVGTTTAATGAVDDWRALSRVAYEYRGRARGANGTSTYGPWAPATRNEYVNPSADTDLTGWGQNSAVIARSTGRFYTAPASIQITPNGGPIYNGLTATGRAPCFPGNQYLITAAVWSPVAWAEVWLGADWYLTLSGGTIQGTWFGTVQAVPARQWVLLAERMTAPAGIFGLVPIVRGGAYMPASLVWNADDINVVPI